MPNWCHNSGEIVTPSWRVATDIIEHTNAGTLLNWMVPMPDKIFKGNLGEAERKKYGHDNWYDWAIANWSTKWDVCDGFASVHKEGDEYSVELSFNTAWCPPERAYETLWERDNITRINMYYEEPGMEFKGYWVDGYDKPEEWRYGYCDGCETEVAIENESDCSVCGQTTRELTES